MKGGLSRLTVVPAVALAAWAAAAPTAGAAEALGGPAVELTVPAGPYHVVTIPVEGGVLWVALRGERVSAAHVVVDKRGFYELDPSGLALEGDRLRGTLTGRYYDDARARPGAPATFTVDCTLQGGQAVGDTPGTVRTAEELAKENPIAAGKDWPFWYGPTGDFRGAADGNTLVEDLAEARLVWVSEVALRHPIVWTPTGYGGFSSPIVADNKVFFNQFRASGTATYDHRTDAPPEPINDQKRRLIAADDEVYCFDARTGALLWKQVFPDASVNQPLKDKHCMFNKTGCYRGGKVYIMGFTWRLYCLDAETGRLIWQGDIGKAHEDAEKQKQEMVAAGKLWNLRGGDNSFLAIADGVLFVYNHLGGTNGYDAETGALLWTVPGRPMRWATGGKEYILCLANETLRCIEPRTGRERWQADVGGMGWSKSLLLTGDYLLTQTGNWKEGTGGPAGWKLSPDGATRLWQKDIGWNHPAGGVHCGDGESLFIRWMWRGGNQIPGEERSLTRIVAATGEVAAVNANVPSGGWHGMQWLGGGRLFSSRDTCHGFGYLRMFRPATLEQMGGEYVSQGGSGYDVPMAYPYVDGRLFLRGMYRIYCYDLRARAKAPPAGPPQ